MSLKIPKHFDDHVLWVGSTDSEHLVACAAGVAAIEAYRDEGLIDEESEARRHDGERS